MSFEPVKPARVTVLLSAYNGSKYLHQQLDSLYGQTYPEIRILVRDDGSTDATGSILGSEQAKGHIEILEGRNNFGVALSFFELLRSAASSGAEYVAFCDQDDVWFPEKIARAVATLIEKTGSGPVMYCSRLEIVDENLTHIGYTDAPRKIGFGNALVENIATGCTIVLNRKAIDLISNHLPGKVLIHDWWCYLLLSCFGEIVFDHNPGIKYRQHGGNTVGIAGNMFSRWERKFRRFFGRGDGHRWISGQAADVLDIFGDGIPPAHRALLDRFVGSQTSLRGRLSLALSGDIWRQKWSDNLILRFLILINRI